ncbi:MAG: sulfatase [Planctomycetota bacterium]
MTKRRKRVEPSVSYAVWLFFLFALLGASIHGGAWAAESTVSAEPTRQRPNILWLIVEDMSPNFSCYGNRDIQTPAIDQLATSGVRFTRAFTTAPICSTARSALITGMYQTTIGAHHHRSGTGSEKILLPDSVPLVPALFQQAGYYTTNSGYYPANRVGKTDYNFEYDPRVYDGTDWRDRQPGQPFFAQIQLLGGKIRDIPREIALARKQLGSSTPAESVHLPPYYPRTPAVLEDWAATLDAIRITDRYVGEIIDRLRQEKLLDNTVIFFITDHGVSHARGKQFLYDEGIQIPIIIRGPQIPSGKVRDDLVEHIDLAATSLALAGISLPPKMQGRDILAPNYQPRTYTFAARDRADETVDRIRSVRTERWKYIRNFYPQRPYLQPNVYKDNKPCLVALRAAQSAGLLDAVQQQHFAATRPTEELYDLQADPWEIHNLATHAAHTETLAQLRKHLEDWMERTADQGRTAEAAARYDSDMAVYLKSQQSPRRDEIERNIALMKQWAREGK